MCSSFLKSCLSKVTNTRYMEHETGMIRTTCSVLYESHALHMERTMWEKKTAPQAADWIRPSTPKTASPPNMWFSLADDEAITHGEVFVWAHLLQPQDPSHYSMRCVMKEWPRALPNNLLIPQGIVQGGRLHNEPKLHAANPLGSLCPPRETGMEIDSSLRGCNINLTSPDGREYSGLFKPFSCQSFPWFSYICRASHNTE